MSYISLYRKYRPKKFSDIVGQDVIVKILTNSIKNDKIGHAYIFSGPRGTGKTSIAKIFAKAVNCLNNNGDVCDKCEVCKQNYDEMIDIIEIDAASNNGVEEIREIRNSVKLMPSNLKYKVYIVDEVHMLSTSAFNALLKTLEEPPSYVIFILATTEFNKIPSTVISRCQKLEFKKIKNKDIVNRLKYILDQENKSIDEEILTLISELSDGGLRDAINTLDQIISLNKVDITKEELFDLIGELPEEKILELLAYITTGNISNLIQNINDYYNNGKNIYSICNKLEIVIKNVLIYNNTDGYFSKEYEKKLSKFNKINYDKLLEVSKILFELLTELKRTNNQRILSEIYFIKMTILFIKKEDNNKSEITEKIDDKIEKNINTIITTNHDNIENSEVLENNKKINEIKINNSLFGANKQLKNEFIEKFSSINEYIFVKEFNAISNLLLKSTVEVVSDKNILFTFKDNFDVVLFEKNIDDIQKLIKKLYNNNYSIVAVTTNEWKEIKKQYIYNIKNNIKYEYIDENIKKSKSKKKTELQNNLENIFGDNYVSM